jgi:tetratricopeptide (TPR) repeat protein
VAAAAHGDVDVLDVLSSLVDKSLIRAVESAGSQRFSMLQTIREYAAERLAADQVTEGTVRLAHARAFSRYAADLRSAIGGPDREAALEDLSSEIGNLRTAWRYWVEAQDLEQLYLLLDGLWALHDARGWYRAAIELASDLLAVLASSEPSPGRDAEEMTLRTSLARALLAVRGYTVEVEEEFTRALELAPPGDAAHRFRVLRALATYRMNLADFAGVVMLGRELLDIAEQERDGAMLVAGHLVLGAGTAFTGDLETGLRHLEAAIELFDPKRHAPGPFHLGTSPGVVARTTSALLLRQRGFPERAAARAEEALQVARDLHHPYSLAYALYHVAFFDLNRQRFDLAMERAFELASVATENDYPVWRALASVVRGVGMCASGRAEEGLAMTQAGLDLYRGLTTPPVFWPPLLALRAAAFAMAGMPQDGLHLIDEAIALSPSDAMAQTEFALGRGDLISALPVPDWAEVEEAYRSALSSAGDLGIRLTQLQAATRLVALLRAQGRSPDGSEALAAIYDTFTEGFAEPELVAARALLDGG